MTTPASERARGANAGGPDRSRRGSPTQLAALLILAFATVTLWNLDRFPRVHGDEAWRLSPAYKLFTQGVYGSDLLAGLLGTERHYFEFMPLMPLLEGAATRLFGVGVWQMRLPSALLGTLTLVLTFRLARRLADSLAGVISLLLLLFWQWTASGDAYLASGVPLVDASRIARYDILAAALGLGVLSCIATAREPIGPGRDFLSGLLAGLACLTHFYGLAWIPVLLLLLYLDRRDVQGQTAMRRAAFMLSGAMVGCSIWIAVIVANWADFAAQTMFFRGYQFDLLNPSFYVHNLLSEHSRYRLGLRDPGGLGRPGLWLLLLGAPAAVLWASHRAGRLHDREARVLLVPIIVFQLSFALLVKSKTFNHLVSIVPLVAILVACWMAWSLRSLRRGWRALVQAALALTILQGASGIAHMLALAGQAEPPDRFFRELRQAVPASGRVLAPPEYWLALAGREHRSLYLPFMLMQQTLARPLPLEAALREISPRFVVLPLPPPGPTDHPSFWHFMAERRALVIRELRDQEGRPVRVYELDP